MKLRVGICTAGLSAWQRDGAWTRLFTLLAVIVGWVFFRAESIYAALQMLAAMGGGNGLMRPEAPEHLAFARLCVAWHRGNRDVPVINRSLVHNRRDLTRCYVCTELAGMGYRTANQLPALAPKPFLGIRDGCYAALVREPNVAGE